MSLWLNHLALSATQQLGAGESSQLFAPSTRGLRFSHLDAATASSLLRDYVELYEQGVDAPLPIFPETSYAWARQTDTENAMRKALTAWNGSDFDGGIRGECVDDFIQLALHNNMAEPLADPRFQHYARQVYGPAIARGGEID